MLQAHRQSPSHRRLQKHAKSQGPLLRRHYPASTLIRPCPTPAVAVAFRNVEAATLAHHGSPSITRTTFPTCRAHYPGGSSGCSCRLLPAPVGAFPVWQVGRHPHCHFRGLLRLHSRYGPPDRSATQGDLCHEAPAHKPLVSFRTYRQLSGWNPPPLMIRAFGAHCQKLPSATQHRGNSPFDRVFLPMPPQGQARHCVPAGTR